MGSTKEKSGSTKEKSIEEDPLSILAEFLKRVLKWGKTIQMTETENNLLPRGVEIDISSEVYRLYRFPKGESVMIKKPKILIVDDQGIHNVVDKSGYSHTVPLGWIHLKFKVETGKSHFYFQKKEKLSKEEEENNVKKV